MQELLLQAGGLGGFWDDYGADLSNLSRYAVGILVYALIVNAFYQVISKRVMFGTNDAAGRAHVGGPGRGFLYLLMFPLISLAFFLLISASLLYLSGDDLSGDDLMRNAQVRDIFTVAMALIAAIRAAAYFSEATSHDVAKMLPLGFLGVFLVTGRDDTATLTESLTNIGAIFTNLDTVAIFFAIVVVLEYLLRTIYLIVKAIKDSKKPRVPKMTPVNTQRPPLARPPYGRQ